MNAQKKLQIFMAIMLTVAGVALFQGFRSEGSRRVIPFIFGFMALTGNCMLLYAMIRHRKVQE